MRAQLKNIPENPTYGESATLMMFEQANLPIEGPGEICVPSGRKDILSDFNSRSDGANKWIPLELWGSDMYFENLCAASEEAPTPAVVEEPTEDDELIDDEAEDDDNVELDDEPDNDDDDDDKEEGYMGGSTNFYM